MTRRLHGDAAASASESGVPRRRFLVGAMAAGAGLVVGYRLLAGEGAEAAPPDMPPDRLANPFAGYVRIDEDGRVTILSAHMDGGQGIYHGIATLVQEELDADWAQIAVEGGFGDPRLYGNPFLGGMQATGGSTGTAASFERYRRAGATARVLLVSAAAAAWKVPASEITAALGKLSHPSGRTASYGAFAAAAAKRPVPADVALKAPQDWIHIGSETLRRYDSAAKSTGRQDYTIDLQLPGLLTAVMIHPPLFGAVVKSFDAAKAKAVDGVVAVVAIPRGVAVVATGMWPALKARDLVTVEWDESRAEKRGSADLAREYHAAAAKGGEAVAVRAGDVDAALAAAATRLEAVYEFPFLAHAAMEPLNAAVRMNADGTLEIWGGHQYPDHYQALAAELAGIAPDKVVLRVMKTGGSFGRRAVFDADVIAEALTTAKALGFRAPVRMQWTRENDMRAGQYRPAYLHRMTAGLDGAGRLVAWHGTIVGQSIAAGTPFESWIKDGVDPTSVEGAATMPYAVPNRRIDLTSPKVGVPVSFWRSVGMNHCCYAVESFIDEAAAAAGRDPLEFRLALLGDHPRIARVLTLAAGKAGWGGTLPPGHGRGIAVGETFGTLVAQVAEVSVERGVLRVHRVVCAVDCGIAVNPDQIRAQMEGGIGFGLGAVLKSRITLDAGRVVEGNYDAYEVLRLNDMPRVDVHIVKSDAKPTGAGEPGVPPVGPAVANAVFAATGKRVRALPFPASFGA